MATDSEQETTSRGAAASSGRPERSSRTVTAARPGNRGVLVVPALLVVALVLLVVGLVTSGSTWLAASLVASVLAAVLLVAERLVQRRRSARAESDAPASGASAAGDTGEAGADDPAPVDLDPPAIDPDDPEAVWVVDGRPRYHARDCATLASLTAEPVSRTQALEDGFVACSLCEPGTAPSAQHTG